MDGFKRIELAVFMLIGKIVAVVGFSGALVTVLFDRIAGRGSVNVVLGPMQLTGIIAFIALGLFGLYADVFLNDTIKPMIRRYLET